MKELVNSRNLITVNFTIISYFILLFGFNFYKVDSVIVGVFIEILTIPFLIAQFVFIVIGIKFLMIDRRSILTITSVLALAVCSMLTVGSFF